MRYRRPKDYKEKIEKLIEKQLLVQEIKAFVPENKKEVFLEIGMGRGDFITKQAQRFPQYYFVGIEKQTPLLILAGQKIQDAGLENICLMSFDAAKIEEFFPENFVDGIYLNFSDPWSKQRYAKRRLTHIEMLERYRRISKKGAKLKIKTDNPDFFEFTLAQIRQSEYRIEREIRDLYAESSLRKLSDNDPILIQTEYEKKFISLKKTIFSLECSLD